MQCTGTERKQLTNEVGAVLGLLAASRLAVAPGRKFSLGACRCPQVPRSSGERGNGTRTKLLHRSF